MTEPLSGMTVEVAGEIAHIRFTRPDLLNRFDEALHTEFPLALASLQPRLDIAALIISAEGRAFSAGGDMEMILRANRSKPLRERLVNEAFAIVETLNAIPYPVIAAVPGAAIGLGASIIGCCDMVVAWREAKIGDPHVVLGLVAGDGGLMAWSQSVGIMRAKRYLLTGEAIDAETAFAMGMVTDLVDSPEDALPAAMALARRIVALPRGGVRGTKRAFGRLSRSLYMAAFEYSHAWEVDTLAGDEVRETVETALAARRDKR